LDTGLRQIQGAWAQFHRALLNARRSQSQGHMQSTAAWARVAADFAFHRHPGFFVSGSLESVLLEASRRIGKRQTAGSNGSEFLAKNDPTKKHVLHVATKTYATGGHTRVIERWVQSSANDAIHSLITTAKGNLIPTSLTSSIIRTGGRCGSVPDPGDLQGSAIFLRKIAVDWADVVVLHTHAFDALPILAFGTDGGPPVVLFNHADFAFWLGASVADVVADFRTVGQQLSRNRRGIRNSKMLPIPLSDPESGPSCETARQELGINSDATVLLTIGQPERYTPFGEYDFVGTISRILARNPKSILLVVGPQWTRLWKVASAAVNGRIIVLGRRTDLERLYASADIYLPSFPVGGLTALLDAGLRGIPIVGLRNREAPMLCGEDDPSLDGLTTHLTSCAEYERVVERMIREALLRNQKGAELKAHVEAIHTGTGWSDHLAELMRSLPSEHCTTVPDPPQSAIDSTDTFLAGLARLHPANDDCKAQ
jgi:hypothetical protein